MSETSFPKSEIKVLLLEGVHPVASQAFAAEGFAVETVKSALPEAELIARMHDVHVLGIRSKTQVTAAVLDAGNTGPVPDCKRIAGGNPDAARGGHTLHLHR